MAISAGHARTAKRSPRTREARNRQAIETAIALARPLPPPCASPALVLLSGLPGSGKTTFAAALRKLAPVAVITSDDVRAATVTVPSYTKAESGRVFAAIRAAAAQLLSAGHSTLIDATNLIEGERAIMYRAAAETGARLVVVLVTAPPEVVRERLEARANADPATADVMVYERMRPFEERITRPHFVVDTSGDYLAAVRAVAREIAAR